MSDNLKIALAICITFIFVNAMHIYFSPYQTCIRSGKANEVQCASIAGGQVKMNGSVSVDGSISLDR